MSGASEGSFAEAVRRLEALRQQQAAVAQATATNTPPQAGGTSVDEGNYLDELSKQLDIDDKEAEVNARRQFRWFLYWLMVAWLIVVVVILVLTAIKTPVGRVPEDKCLDWVGAFELSDPVLMALIGGTTANVIGLFWVVARSLYPYRDTARNKK